jgi:protein phosphatase
MSGLTRFWMHLRQNIAGLLRLSDRQTAVHQLETGLLTDTGRSREVNQDSIGVFRSPDGKALVAVVADGMGGHQAGDIASKMAVEAIQQNYFAALNRQSPEQVLRRVIELANDAIYDQAQQNPEHKGMGTTLTVLALHESEASFAHTGDSRLYRIRNHEIHQLTEDHTLVAEMLREGLIDAKQARNHPDKHIITHAVGTAKSVHVDTHGSPVRLHIGDCFVLCSDGLYDLVEDREIMNLSAGCPAQQACEELVRLANARGGHDNISVIIIRVLPAPSFKSGAPITRV